MVESGAFSASIRQSGTVSLVDLSGRLTSFEVGALRDTIARLLKEGRRSIVLNLSGVGLSPKVEEVLKVTQLYQVFPEFPSEEEAVESFPE